jgi:predicted CXXCH cytochrome family protein
LAPVPHITNVVGGPTLTLDWVGFAGPYQVERSSSVAPTAWEPLGPSTTAKTLTLTPEGNIGFLRVKGQNPHYAGYSPCLDCHYDQYERWAATPHASALATLKQIGQHTNAVCLQCHTVGFGLPNGFKDEASTPGLAGVQCESCHGPAAEHLQNPADNTKRPIVELSAAVCGGCHTDFHHPTYDEWTESKHAQVVETLAEEFRAPSGPARIVACGPCHSGAARVTMVKNTELSERRQWALPSGEDAAAVGITCAVCHDPHGSANSGQLRNPVRSLTPFSYSTSTSTTFAAQYKPEVNVCGQCHNLRGASWQNTSRSPHYSPQYNILVGSGGVEPDVPPFQSEHRDTPKQCADCHTHRHDTPDPSPANPVYTGHNFQVNLQVCSQCHDADALDALWNNGIRQFVARETEQLVADLNQWGATKAPSSLRTKYGRLAWEYNVPGHLSNPNDIPTLRGPTTQEQQLVPDNIKQARFNLYLVYQDQSQGIHNPGYVHSLLKVAADKVKAELSQ